MKKGIVIVCIVIIAIFCFYSINKSYPTPEAFCASQKIYASSIVYGNNSAFVMYQESASKSRFAFLKRTNTGYVSIGFHEVQKKVFGSDYSAIYAGNNMREHYIVVLLTTNTGVPQIKDSLSSTFCFFPIELPDHDTVMGYYALAYIGEEPDTYYQKTYSLDIVETAEGSLSQNENPN